MYIKSKMANIFFVIFVMAVLSLPKPETIAELSRAAAITLSKRVYFNEKTDTFQRKVCAVCDRIATVDNPFVFKNLLRFKHLLNKSGATKANLLQYYHGSKIFDSYGIPEAGLDDYVLSPAAKVFTKSCGSQGVLLCNECNREWETQARKRSKKKLDGPRKALWKGLLVGEIPPELEVLNRAEAQLVSANRVHTHAVVLQANAHEGIFGWHSLFENRVDLNVATVQYLLEAGMKGEIVCVLCGPFTKTQEARTRDIYGVRPDKVIAALNWLKNNNHYYKDIKIPSVDEIPQPAFIKHSSL